MESSERILVIILAAALAIFLILGIIALVKIIQVLNHIKHVSEKAERIADKAEAVGEFFQNAATPLALGRLVANISESFMGRKRRKGRRYDDE